MDQAKASRDKVIPWLHSLLQQNPNHKTQTLLLSKLAAYLWNHPPYPQTHNSSLIALFQIEHGNLDPKLQKILDQLWRELPQRLPNKTALQAPEQLGLIHETLLQSQLRQRLGVYFTPPPLADFLLRTLDSLLEPIFGPNFGLFPENKSLQRAFIIDPAAGSGIFPLRLLEMLHKSFSSEQSKSPKLWAETVRTKLLPNINALELMHSSQQLMTLAFERALQNTGFSLQASDQLQLFQGNSLEQPKPQSPLTRANIFIGNPPYGAFGRSHISPWLSDKLEDYKSGLSDKKLNLDDDFIKFLCLAHQILRLEQFGALAFVVNASYLEAPTRRRLRESLLADFNNVLILDLGGSRFETTLEHSRVRDENLFDIQTGVSILFAIKDPNQKAPRLRYHALRGTRQQKLRWLQETTPESIPWQELSKRAPLFLFKPATKSSSLAREKVYQSFLPLEEIFQVAGSGVKTDRDALCYDSSRERLEQRMSKAFSGDYNDEFRKKYRLESTSSYPLLDRLKQNSFDPRNLTRCLYRPFDERWLYYQRGFTSRPAWAVMQHLRHHNLALLAKKQARPGAYTWVFSSQGLTADGAFAIDNRGRETAFPLYLQKPDGSTEFNFAVPIPYSQCSQLQADAQGRQFFAYIYGILHVPSYRRDFQDLLRRSFPKIPKAPTESFYKTMAALGQQLLELHTKPQIQSPAEITLQGNHLQIGRGYPKYSPENLQLNSQTILKGIEPELWEMVIGGHQVCRKWLRDRRKEPLSLEDLQAFKKILTVLRSTRKLQKHLDIVWQQQWVDQP